MRIDFLLEDPAVIEKLYSAIRLDARVQARCQLSPLVEWEELEARAERSDFDVAFVQPSFPLPNRSQVDGVLRLLNLSDQLGPGRLIPFLCRPPFSPGLLQNLGDIPAPIILIKGVDDEPRTILRALARSWAQRKLDSFRPAPAKGKEPVARQTALVTMIGWPPPESASEVAKRLHLGARTHRRLMRAAGFPSPAGLIRWGRLLEAVALWRLGMGSQKQIAMILGMGRADALSALAQSLTGYPWEAVVKMDLPELPPAEVFAFEEQRGGECA